MLALLLMALKSMSLVIILDEFANKLNQFGGSLILSPVMVESCNPSVPKRIGRATELLAFHADHQVFPSP